MTQKPSRKPASLSRGMAQRVIFALAMALCPGFPTARAADIVVTVTSPAELSLALLAARGGETIKLAAGNYGKLDLSTKSGVMPQLNRPVTLTSADPNNPAVLLALSLTGVSNLTFDNLVFDYVSVAGASLSASPFAVVESDHITFQNAIFDGDLAKGVNAVDDGYGAGRALTVGKSEHITVQNCQFSNWYRAMVFDNSRALRIIKNEVSDSSSDGFNFARVEDVLIAGNHLHDFKVAPNSKAHPDMIQFWTAGEETDVKPSRDITIANNFLDMGEGTFTQSIFMRNEKVDQGLAGRDMFYRNIVITNNVIANGHINGITVGETDGLVITRNTLVQKASLLVFDKSPAPMIRVVDKAVNVTVSNNITPGLAASPSAFKKGWVVRKNLIVQSKNRAAANFTGKVLLNPMQPKTGVRGDYTTIPGSNLALKGIGATLDDWTIAPEASDSP